MSAATDSSVAFSATLEQAEGMKATGIEVPAELIESLGGGKRPAVRAVVNGHEFPKTIGSMGGRSMLPISAALRATIGIEADDPVDVTLTLDVTPRTVDVPAELASALAAEPKANAYFETLSNSLQRYHADQVASAKSDETRQRRIDKAIGLFLAGKPR